MMHSFIARDTSRVKMFFAKFRYFHYEKSTTCLKSQALPPSPSRRGRGIQEPSPLAGEGRERGSMKPKFPIES